MAFGMLIVWLACLFGALAAAVSGCTVERVILYETIQYPAVTATPTNRIGPS